MQSDELLISTLLWHGEETDEVHSSKFLTALQWSSKHFREAQADASLFSLRLDVSGVCLTASFILIFILISW